MFLKRAIGLSFVCVFLVGCSGKTKEQLYARGMAEMRTSNLNGAIVYFRHALEKDQNYYTARHGLAKAYMMAGKTELAEKEFHKTLLQAPSRVEVKLELAKLHILSNKPDEAKREIQEYVNSKGETPETLELTGITYAAKGDTDNAERYLLKSLKAGPSSASVKLELAKLYAHFRMQGKEGEARRLVEEVISSDPLNTRAYHLLAELEIASGHVDKALGIYLKISEIDKSNIPALYKSGLLYVEKGQPDKAEQISGELVRRFPWRAEGSRLKGIIAFRKKNYLEAVPALQISIKAGPSPEAYYYLGLCHYNLGALETALSQFRMIFENNPFSRQARFFAALVLLKQQRLEDSIAEIRKLLADNPGFALAHNLLGTVYMAEGMYDEGMRELNRAIDMDPSIIDAHMKKGIFHLRSGRLREAETDFATAVKISPELLSTRLVLSSFYIRQNNYAKAMSLLNQGIGGKKSDAILYNNMAVIMHAENKLSEALKYLEKAKNSDPSYLGASFNIATCYAAGNRTDKALQEYRDILRKDPRNGRALLNMAALLELKGHDDEACGYYKKAVETKEETAYLALANYLMRKKLDKDALSVLDNALKAVPRNLNVLEMKKQILLIKKQFREAIDVCEDIALISPKQGVLDKINIYMTMKDVPKALELTHRFITLNPNSAFGYMMLAGVYEDRNELVRATDEIKKGIRADRENLQAILMLGNLYTKIKDYKSAMAAYKEALQKDPDFAAALFAQGAMLEKTGKKKEAAGKYRDALMKSENYVPAINNLAYLYINGYGSSQEGLRLAFLGFRMEPANPEIMDTLGYALLKNGRGAEAQNILKKAAVLLPGDPTVGYHLALAFKENGMPDMAITTLRKSLSHGDFAEASDARKLLDQMSR